MIHYTCVCMHTSLHDCMQTSLCTYISCLCLSSPPPTHTMPQQYTNPNFGSFLQVVGCVLHWPCPTQSSGWLYPTDVGSWVWSSSSGQTPGGDVPLWCEWGEWWSEWMGSNGRSEWVINLCSFLHVTQEARTQDMYWNCVIKELVWHVSVQLWLKWLKWSTNNWSWVCCIEKWDSVLLW